MHWLCSAALVVDGAATRQLDKRLLQQLRRALASGWRWRARFTEAKSAVHQAMPKSLPMLADFRDECLTLLERILTASNKRHDLIHGAISELRPDPVTGAFKFRRIGYIGDSHTISEFSVTPDDFRAFSPILRDLVTDSIAFSQKLGDRFLKRTE